jgi:hypothetical protein
MSYNKAIKWNKKHPKGTKQPVIMHANSGFWPSIAFSKKWIKYAEECESKGETYLDIESYYRKGNNL